MKKPSYIVEFDTLRAVAALGVMVAHFAPLQGIWEFGTLERRLGAVGVDLFFALSGFLITGILLNCKRLSAEQTAGQTLRQFYARRFLRIFPLYYLAFAVFAFWLSPAIRDNTIWFLTYTVNFGKAVADNWFPLNHFWTLAVEEQFYILWPFIVLASSKKLLVRLCIGGACASFAARAALAIYGAGDIAVYQFTTCCLEPLLLGSAFSTLALSPPSKRIWRLITASGLITSVVFLFADDVTFSIFSRAACGVFFSSLIYVIACHTGHRRLKSLRLKPLVFLGQISYGLYVWHLPVLWALGRDAVSVPDWMPRGTDRIVEFAALVATTVLVSIVSWYAFERPINSLKRRFPYRVPTSEPSRVAA